MGSYSELAVGHFSLGEWKSHAPLEPLLMFTQEDYTEGPDLDEADYVLHKFVTTVKDAKKRMDARGFTIATCRHLFDEFKTTGDWNYDDDDEANITPNKVSFDGFLAGCKEMYKKTNSRYISQDTKVDPKVKRMFEEGFFDTSVEHYFPDVFHCILQRAFLEVAKPEHKVKFDLSALVHGGYVDADVEKLYDHYMSITLRRIGLDYQLYGFVIENDPNVNARLRKRIGSMDEDDFIEHVLVPLFQRMGYERVRAVDSHGRNEFGADILPFRFTSPLGTFEYYALQAKAVQIHGKSAQTGNAGELISQATQAFNVAWIDDSDNEQKKIDKFIIATNKAITPDARRVIDGAIEGERNMILLDIDKIVDLVKQHRLLQYLLFTDLESQFKKTATKTTAAKKRSTKKAPKKAAKRKKTAKRH